MDSELGWPGSAIEARCTTTDALASELHARAVPPLDALLELPAGCYLLGEPDALAALVCAIEAEHPAGDHSIVLGRVLAIRHGDEQPPPCSSAATSPPSRPQDRGPS